MQLFQPSSPFKRMPDNAVEEAGVRQAENSLWGGRLKVVHCPTVVSIITLLVDWI